MIFNGLSAILLAGPSVRGPLLDILCTSLFLQIIQLPVSEITMTHDPIKHLGQFFKDKRAMMALYCLPGFQ